MMSSTSEQEFYVMYKPLSDSLLVKEEERLAKLEKQKQLGPEARSEKKAIDRLLKERGINLMTFRLEEYGRYLSQKQQTTSAPRVPQTPKNSIYLKIVGGLLVAGLGMSMLMERVAVIAGLMVLAGVISLGIGIWEWVESRS